MCKRRFQTVLLREELGEIFAVVLHLDFKITFCKRFAAKMRQNPTIIEVVQLCNYRLRIHFADCGYRTSDFEDSSLVPSLQWRARNGNGRTKAGDSAMIELNQRKWAQRHKARWTDTAYFARLLQYMLISNLIFDTTCACCKRHWLGV